MSKLAQFLEAGSLRVQFTWQADRWGHAIGFVDEGHFRAALQSIEGATEDVWPCSPPFQELQIEPRGTGNVALLVGQTPQCHWSLSIEADTSASTLRFDVACRVPSQELLGTLSSTYQSLAGKPVVQANVWVWSNRMALQAERGSSLWPATDGGVVIEADPVSFDFPATFRWQYIFHYRE